MPPLCGIGSTAQTDWGEGSAFSPCGAGQMNIPLTVVPTVLGIAAGVPLTAAPVDEHDRYAGAPARMPLADAPGGVTTR
jgi:hypothetical protein